MSVSTQALPGGYPVVKQKTTLDQLAPTASEKSRLLYAAQVAYLTNRPQVRFTKKSSTKVEQSGTQVAILEHTNPHVTRTE